jgi:hypothetical protein
MILDYLFVNLNLMLEIKQQIESLLPERLINAPNLERKLRRFEQWEDIKLVEHDYFGMTFPFELGSSNSIKVYEVDGQSQISITVNVY